MAVVYIRAAREVRYLFAQCGVRYWEDASVNGTADDDGARIPFRQGDTWAPVIDLDAGRVVDWPEGVTAKVHYKVCDEGVYRLLDADREVICEIDGYVPKIMCPGGEGYGDYVIMSIGPDGAIADWRLDLSEFDALQASEAGR